MKICNGCVENKEDLEFNKQSKSKDGLQGWCRSCQSILNRKHQQKRNDYKLVYRYGITREDYNRMLAEQDYCCKICKVKSIGNLDVDHNHNTGEVRALLCRRCNVTLGALEEDKELLMKFIWYLRSFEQ